VLRLLNAYAETGFVQAVSKTSVRDVSTHDEIQSPFTQSDILSGSEIQSSGFLSTFFIRWARRKRVSEGFRIFWRRRQLICANLFSARTSGSQPRWTSTNISYDPTESDLSRRLRSTGFGVNFERRGNYHHPRSFNFRERSFGNIRLTLDRPPLKSGNNNVCNCNVDDGSTRRRWPPSFFAGLVLCASNFLLTFYGAKRFSDLGFERRL